MSTPVNNPRAAEQLRREYGVAGDRIKLSLDDVVVPVALVSDLTAGASGVPLVRRAYATFTQAAVVGEYTTWRLEVPSGFVVVVHRVLLVTPAAGFVRVHWGTSIPAPANLATTQLMDGRLRETLGMYPAARLSYGTQIGVMPLPFKEVPAGAGTGIDNVVEWLFGRDDGLYDFIEFQWPTLNSGVTCCLEWDEAQVGA